MVREGWLKHGPGHGEGRGREPFVPVSWDKALDLVAGEIERVRREHGNAAIMGGSQGWSSAGIFHEARVQLHRFLAAGGGYIDQVMNYSFGAALAFLPHIVGTPAVGGRPAHLVVVDRAALQADGAVRRRQSEEHAGQQGRLRVALDQRLDRRAGHAPASRSSTSVRSARTDRRPVAPGVDSDPAEHRHRDAARAHAHAGQRRSARPGIPRHVTASASSACCPI